MGEERFAARVRPDRQQNGRDGLVHERTEGRFVQIGQLQANRPAHPASALVIRRVPVPEHIEPAHGLEFDECGKLPLILLGAELKPAVPIAADKGSRCQKFLGSGTCVVDLQGSVGNENS